jgi:hypothetical protein
MLLFEGGEALRFEGLVTQAAVRGIVGVMHALGMLPKSRRRPAGAPFVAQSTGWVRAPESGLLVSDLALGAAVEEGQVLAVVSDPFGQEETPVLATKPGIVIGRLRLPLVNEGDALFHIAHAEDLDEASSALEGFEDALDAPLPDDPE